MPDPIVAAAAWIIVGWLPGYALSRTLRFNASFMRNAALAPMVSFGLTMFAAQLVTLVGGRVEPITVLPISLGAPLLACAVAALRARSAVSPAPTVAERFSRCRLTLRRADVRLLLAAFLLALCIWTISIPSLSSVLPDSDGTHHALFAKRIMDLDTIDPRRVLAGDLTAGPQGGAYYPLALHLEAALIADITGLSVNTALTVGFVLAASVQLPTATYLLSRRLIPELGRLAAVAAVVAVVIPWFPYSAIWGAVPLIVGMSCVPAAVDALLVRRSDGSPVPVGILLGTAAFGLFTEHNTELVTAFLFTAIVAVVWWRQGILDPGRPVRIWLIMLGILTVLVIPLLGPLISGGREATAFLGNAPSPINSPWLTALFVVSPLVLAFAVGGMLRAPAWTCLASFCCVAAVALLLIGTLVQVPVLTFLTTPWYSNWIRVSYLFSFFQAAFAAVGVVAFTRWVRRAARGQRWRTAAGIAAVLLACLMPVFAAATASGIYGSSSLAGPTQRAAFSWLAEHTRPDQRVLNQFLDGSGWMETLAGVTPVFAVNPDTPPIDPQAVWGDRWYLLTHAAGLASDLRAQHAVQTWNIRFVYVNDESFGDLNQRLSSNALARSPAYSTVWHRGPVTIFAIENP